MIDHVFRLLRTLNGLEPDSIPLNCFRLITEREGGDCLYTDFDLAMQYCLFHGSLYNVKKRRVSYVGQVIPLATASPVGVYFAFHKALEINFRLYLVWLMNVSKKNREKPLFSYLILFLQRQKQRSLVFLWCQDASNN